MPHRIGEVEDIGADHEARLIALGIAMTDDLLARAATPSARAGLAGELGVDVKDLLRWANCADLMRIDGVGMQFADLLEAAGVDTVPELAQRNGANLHARIVAVNAERQLTGRLPTEGEVAAWVEQAKGLPRTIHFRDDAAGDAPAEPAAETTVTPVEAAVAAVAPPPAPAEDPAPVTAAPSASATRPFSSPAERKGLVARVIDGIRGRS